MAGKKWKMRIIYRITSLMNCQWLFIIFGILTFLWGLLMLFRLPNSPTDASFLTDEERMIAVERLKGNKTGFKNTHIDRCQIMECFKDPKTLLLGIMVLTANIPNGGYTTVSTGCCQSFSVHANKSSVGSSMVLS